MYLDSFSAKENGYSITTLPQATPQAATELFDFSAKPGHAQKRNNGLLLLWKQVLFTVDQLEPSVTTCCTAFLTALNKWIIVFATLSYDFKLIKKSLAEQLEQLPESDSRLGYSEK